MRILTTARELLTDQRASLVIGIGINMLQLCFNIRKLFINQRV
jgi:hypothetical protein